jgi:hypothetical protein
MMMQDGRDPMAFAQALIAGAAADCDNHFLLLWNGTKIPRGAEIDGVEIAWTQHGIITGKGGVRLGWPHRRNMAPFRGCRLS